MPRRRLSIIWKMFPLKPEAANSYKPGYSTYVPVLKAPYPRMW